MLCTKQVMMPGVFNYRILLLKIVLSLLDKSLHTAMTLPSPTQCSVCTKEEKGQQNKVFPASYGSFLSLSSSPSLSAYILRMFSKKATMVRFPWFACLLANLVRVLKVRITSQLSIRFKQEPLLPQTTL